MTAKHRVWAGRRPAEEDPLPVDQGRVTGRDITDGGAVVDWRVSVPGVPAIVSVARRLVRAALRDSPRLGDFELITSELVTNAIRHTPSGETGSLVTLGIQAKAGWARVEVSDLGNASWAEPGSAADQDECGRGLVIVNALADRAGHEPAAGGHISWAEIDWDALPDAGSGAVTRT